MEQNADNDRLRQEDRIYVEFIDDPQAGLERPNTKINTAAGAVFGLLLGVALVFLLEWLASGVMRRGEDVERYLNIPVIGTIPQEVGTRFQGPGKNPLPWPLALSERI
jgi:capsular polysaccharide biosynthesis protein